VVRVVRPLLPAGVRALGTSLPGGPAAAYGAARLKEREMPTYIVTYRHTYRVEAANEDETIDIAEDKGKHLDGDIHAEEEWVF